jgi:hypothetical protein
MINMEMYIYFNFKLINKFIKINFVGFVCYFDKITNGN